MNRVHAITLGLLLVAWAPHSHAGVLTLAAGEPGWTVEGEAVTPDSPAVAGADSESTEGYRSQDSSGTGEVPETLQPSDETKGSESAPAPEAGEGIEHRSPMGTGTMPESVEPLDKSGGGDSPSDSTPGSSY